MSSPDDGSSSVMAGRRRGASSLLVKIAIGLVAWLTAYGIAKFAAQNELWSVGVSTFVSGVVLVIQFLLDVERELHRLRTTHRADAEAARTQLDDAVGTLNVAAKLYREVEESPVATAAMESLIHAVGTLRPPGEAQLMTDFANTEIERLADILVSLQNGEVAYEGEQRDWLIGLTRVAAGSIDAMSLVFRSDGPQGSPPVVDNGLWLSEVGQRYLDAQADAIQHRSVVVRRIFMLDDAELIDDPIVRDLIRQHSDMKVQTLAIAVKDVPELLRIAIGDLAIFGGSIYYRNRPAATIRTTRGTTRSQTQLITRSGWVSGEARRFDELWHHTELPSTPASADDMPRRQP